MGMNFHKLGLAEQLELIERLTRLEKFIRYDPTSGDLVIQNGEARVVLKQSGEIRQQGSKIVQMADESIALNAAYIDIN